MENIYNEKNTKQHLKTEQKNNKSKYLLFTHCYSDVSLLTTNQKTIHYRVQSTLHEKKGVNPNLLVFFNYRRKEKKHEKKHTKHNTNHANNTSKIVMQKGGKYQLSKKQPG